MPIARNRWSEVTPSPHPWEREALDFLRQGLPEHEPWRVWTNFQFIAQDGSVNEVDALVVGRTGVFLVEIKGHPGDVTGDANTLTFRAPDGFRASIDHPLYLANLKAKRLKGLLTRTKTGAKKPLPRIEALVFLSHAQTADLAPPADSCVLLRDLPGRDGGSPERDGILAALLYRRAPGLRPEPQLPVDKPIAKNFSKALDEAGLGRIPGKQRVRDYEIVETLEETALWRDVLGKHVATEGSFRRIRRYFADPDSPLDRDAVTRATQREYQLLERLHHPSILAVKDFTTDEHGPLLLFEHLPGSMRLDRYIAEHGERLSLDGRLAIIRRIAEAVRHAHASRIVHRGLAPQSVLVLPDADGQVEQLRVMNWSAGGRASDVSTTAPFVSATLHPESHTEPASAVYLAPELRQDPASTEPTLDVFSLGALATLLITGRPPASSSDELFERVRDGGLHLAASIEGTSRALDSLVARATDANVSQRCASVDEFLEALDEVEEEEASAESLCEVPPHAVAGNHLQHGLLIDRRLGTGSTAVAFLVKRTEEGRPESYVLKVAREPDQSPRMASEAAVLRQLDHPNVAHLVEELEFGAYRGFLTRPPNDQTLRQRLRSEGALQLELLERFGEQLLGALVHLEERGINHRDIKPDNIGISDYGRNQALALILFDFSLSGAPSNDIRVGTLAYADPFLGEKDRKRWDLYAERYSAGLTLYEMATGVLPRWGDAKSDPRATDAQEITLEPELLPAGVRDQLVAFFLKALARSPRGRFDNAAAMLEAWGKVFQGTHHSPVVEAPEDADQVLAERTAALGVRTLLHELPLSTRASNALDRLSLFTVEDLLRTPPFRLASAKGVGLKTRAELEKATRALREMFPDVEIAAVQVPTPPDEGAPAAPEGLASKTVEELLVLLRPDARRKEEHRRAFDALYGSAVALQVPTQSDAARALNATPQQLQGWIASLRNRWDASGTARALVAEIAAIVDRHHGILSFREASEALIAQRSTARDREEALATASALVRIATDVEALADAPRWRLRRRKDRVWLASVDELVGYAENLGSRALELARQEPLPTRESVEAALSSVERPRGIDPLPPGRVARLAVAATFGAVDLSGRGELYPIDLGPERALKLTIGALAGAGTSRRDPEHGTDTGQRLIRVEEIHDRVHARYPRAVRLPGRPELDQLLRDAGWEFTWSEEHHAYVTRVDDSLTLAPSSTRWHRSRGAARVVTPDDGFEQRVRNAIDTRSFRVLKVHPDDLEPALTALEEHFPELEQVDLDVELANELGTFLAERNIRRDTFFEADGGGPRGRGWANVLRVMEPVLERVTARLAAGQGPLCLRNVGLLGRYELWTPIHALNPQVGARPSRSTLVLLPGDVSSPVAEVGPQRQLPILPGQLIVVPDSWLAPYRHELALAR